MVVATQIKEAQGRKHRTTSFAVDDATYTPVNRQRGGKKPPGDLDKGSSSPPPHYLKQFKPSKHHEGKDSPPNHHKGPFTSKIAEYLVPRAFAKLPKLEPYDNMLDLDEHVEHLDIILDYHRTRGAVK
ncbi:hypothetical protein MtrunA17_Chr0c01g0489451 [Medicago truncatula]|uniref:Uncharacterized protein n=1 Tax=Medicago truncatula TaxID=3880 RepID=A0A396GIP3_MEDTR|nr:hypothetical protein MtrunA17_Chr0c01g0489451 [Medicago truncatula]